MQQFRSQVLTQSSGSIEHWYGNSMRLIGKVQEVLHSLAHSPVLILCGMVLFVAGTALAILDTAHVYREGLSSFEDIPEEGFIPYAAPVDEGTTPSTAPTLAGIAPAVDPSEPSGNEIEPGLTSPTPTPEPDVIPERLLIPKIDLEAPILPADPVEVEFEGDYYLQWVAPDQFAVGWHHDSAPLGEVGNTVLNGHHNVHGEVFRRLEELEPGDQIIILGSGKTFHYVVSLKSILPERDQPINIRLDNASWIMPSEDERITLVTCWPYNSNTHRLVIVASPLQSEVEYD